MTTPVLPYNPFRKERSLKSCIAEGWKLPALRFRTFMRPLWIPMILAGVGGAFLTCVAYRFFLDFLLPAHVYMTAGLDGDTAKMLFMPDILSWLLLFGALVAMLFGCAVARGAVFAQIQHYAETDSLPEVGLLLPATALRATSKRMFLLSAFFGAITVLLFGIILWMSLRFSWWWLLWLVPIMGGGSVYAAIVAQFYILRKLSFFGAIRCSLSSDGFSGGYFPLFVLTVAPIAFLTLVAFFPCIILLLSYFTNAMGVLLGDTAGLPGFIDWLFPLLTGLGFFIAFMGSAVRTWIFAFRTARYLQ